MIYTIQTISVYNSKELLESGTQKNVVLKFKEENTNKVEVQLHTV